MQFRSSKYVTKSRWFDDVTNNKTKIQKNETIYK